MNAAPSKLDLIDVAQDRLTQAEAVAMLLSKTAECGEAAWAVAELISQARNAIDTLYDSLRHDGVIGSSAAPTMLPGFVSKAIASAAHARGN